jgi:hypothetical protein
MAGARQCLQGLRPSFPPCLGSSAVSCPTHYTLLGPRAWGLRRPPLGRWRRSHRRYVRAYVCVRARVRMHVCVCAFVRACTSMHAHVRSPPTTHTHQR